MCIFEKLANNLEVSPIVSGEEIEFIVTELDLKTLDSVEKLVDKRNELVRWFSDKTHHYRIKGDWENFDKYNNASSKSVAVIDNKLYSMRG
jgi:hypothetical protein